jgi:RimJ/RimL family protein N-acetyltransferase
MEKPPMVTLRRLEWDDLDRVHALTSRMDVVRHMLLPLCSRQESEKFLRDSLLESPSEAWRSIVRAITDGPRGDLVGLCGVVILRGAEEGEIWYLVEPESWGKEIATEATRLLLDFARVLQKVGTRKEGFLVDNLKIHGVWKSCHLYAMLAGEWAPMPHNEG